MRFMHVDEVRSGMKLGKPLYNENDGTVLLQANVELTPHYITRVKELGYEYICIKEKDDPEIPAKLDPICEETRAKGIKIVKQTMTRLTQKNAAVDSVRIFQIIDAILSEILADPNVGFDLVQIRNVNNYVFLHTVNVSVIAILIGTMLGLDRTQLEILGVGALLHDVGVIHIDPQILNKPGKLSAAEYEIVKNHARDGFDILKTRVSLSYLAAHIAYQHHERLDGSGYPRGLKGDAIHPFARIVAVADVYDAMTSPRCYQAAIPVALTLREIMQEAPEKFDPLVVAKLAQIVDPNREMVAG